MYVENIVFHIFWGYVSKDEGDGKTGILCAISFDTKKDFRR